MTTLTEIYRCSKREGLYLYVCKGQKIDELPESLLASIGQTELTMTLMLDESKKLAQVDIGDVLSSLSQHGYFLQMPPAIV